MDYLTPNYETVYSTPELFKTGQITPGGFEEWKTVYSAEL
jgi:hypothetical protein